MVVGSSDLDIIHQFSLAGSLGLTYENRGGLYDSGTMLLMSWSVACACVEAILVVRTVKVCRLRRR